MLTIKNLCFAYNYLQVLTNINFSVARGELLLISGNNGTGKTTLLKLIATILTPSSGKIYFKNQNICNDLKSYQHKICYIGHKLGLNDYLTVLENSLLAVNCLITKSAAYDLLTEFSLENFAEEKVATLSAGQKRRLALLRISISNARIWLLDEPFTALDVQSSHLILTKFIKHLNQGGQIIMSSHQKFLLKSMKFTEYLL